MNDFEKILKKYGRDASLCTGEGDELQSGRCFIQPLRYKNKMYLEGTPTPLGVRDSGYYLFLAPPDFGIDAAAADSYVTDGYRNYHVDRCERVYLGREVFFLWAVLKEKTQGDYPYYDHFNGKR